MMKNGAFPPMMTNLCLNVDKICNYDETKIAELMQNPGIIRNRRKIETAINNTKVFKEIQKNELPFPSISGTLPIIKLSMKSEK